MMRAIFVLMFVVFAALAWRVWQDSRAEDEAAARTARSDGRTVRTASPAPVPPTRRTGSGAAAAGSACIFASGYVEAARPEVAARFEAAGRIRAVQFHEGDEVEEGDLLAEIEPDLHELAVAEARAQLAIAVAERDRMMSRESSPAAATTNDEAGVRPAAHTVSQTDRTIADARVTLAQTNLKRATILLEKTKLVAPAAGVVLRTRAEPGELAGPADPAPPFTIVPRGPTRVRAFVEEFDAMDVVPGQAVAVNAVARPDRSYVGRVLSCSPALLPKSHWHDKPGERNDVRVRAVVIDLEDGSGLLPGLPVEACIQKRSGIR